MKSIELIEHLPNYVLVGKSEKKIPLEVQDHSETYVLSYKAEAHNQKGHVGSKSL